MTHSEFLIENYTQLTEPTSFSYQAPSNIALIKYWGKHGIQLPANPSLSFTLSASATTTELKVIPLNQASEEIQFDIFFEGKSKESFRSKIEQFFERIEEYTPFLRDYKFEIHTSNSFPHSSGIASSASSMAALSLCIMALEKRISPNLSETDFDKKASFLARLGSGSASRSVNGPIMVWGQHPAVENSSDLYAIKNNFKIHSIFENYQDCILLIDKNEKEVSSSIGHNLMIGHPFADSRFDQAFVNLDLLKEALISGDIREFIRIVESEALTLHAMMMTSTPYYILMQPNTLKVIQKIWQFRKNTSSNLCFTLDAGANVHLLFPEKEKEATYKFIAKELAPLCQNQQYIQDHTGLGAKKLN